MTRPVDLLGAFLNHPQLARFPHGLCAVLLVSACSSSVPSVDAGSSGGPDADVGDAGPSDAATPDAAQRPDSGTEPPCEASETRVAECGFCGTESQLCSEAAEWTSTSACLGEGECSVGSVEERVTDLCETQQRICLDGCSWSTWEQTLPPGACEPDALRMQTEGCAVGESRQERCSATCTWEMDGACTDACGGAVRSSPEWERDVCIPGGDFVRGQAGTPWSPVATIHISPFYMDVYPVTNRRYRQCVTAGTCTMPEGMWARNEDAFLDFPVQGISRNMAEAFCAWDGGRRLPTSMEWEKAARGPAPRAPVWPWGDEPDCGLVDSGDPPCSSDASPNFASDRYDSFSVASESYYGAQFMGFGVHEWVLDSYCGRASDWYTQPESQVPDAFCAPTSTAAVAGRFLTRSGTRAATGATYQTLGSRVPVDSPYVVGVRCARTP